MKLIDKDALVAEIEGMLRNVNLNYINAGSHPSALDTNKKLQEGISKNLQSILFLLDTLEVKEVDLIKEVANWKIDHQVYGMDETFYDIAKHFFKLGLAQKGG